MKGEEELQQKRILSVFGTRPEAIKMAPLIKELEKNCQFKSIVCVTAQHRQMLDQVLQIFDIKPDFDLNIMKENQSLFDITTRGLEGIKEVIKLTNPDLVLVHGDTTTTFITSLAAFYSRVPIGHVEAGLRTNNKYSPFPEEMNRQLTGVIADLHFAPTKAAASNLINENKKKEHIFITGNTVIDAMQTTIQSNFQHPVLKDLSGKKMILVTVHRRENLGEPIKEIFLAIRKVVETNEDVVVVYPVHLNPVIQEMAYSILGNHPRIKLIEPLDVITFHNIAARSHLIVTDSGGIQEEGPSLSVPVLVLRNVTERPEGVEAGALKLIGTKQEDVFNQIDVMVRDEELYLKMKNVKNPFGDGMASKRIIDAILFYFGLDNQKPNDF